MLHTPQRVLYPKDLKVKVTLQPTAAAIFNPALKHYLLLYTICRICQ